MGGRRAQFGPGLLIALRRVLSRIQTGSIRISSKKNVDQDKRGIGWTSSFIVNNGGNACVYYGKSLLSKYAAKGETQNFIRKDIV